MSLLEVEGLTKQFPTSRSFVGRVSDWHVAVNEVSFALEAGETLALVGESGAGKSTTGRLVLRLIEPDAGTIRFEGRDVRSLDGNQLRTMRRRAQMIFQDPYSSLNPRVQIGLAIGEPLLVHERMRRHDRLEQAGDLLERVGLSWRDLHRLPGELSGGQLQRVAIARALSVRPAMLVCDEPVAALDVSVRAQVLNLMDDLQQDLGLAYLFISHDLALVRVIADRIAVMRQGRIVEVGSAEQIFEDPQHEYSRELLNAVPHPRPSLTGRAGR
jgi:oligopeptide transport system ATP-binding protein